MVPTAFAVHLTLSDWGCYVDVDGRRMLMFVTPVRGRVVTSGVVVVLAGWAVTGVHAVATWPRPRG